jgi:uncharacterized membrane protein YtjA (UPF0391 family)
MLNWTVTLFVIALMAAILGLGRVAGPSADIAWLSALLAVLMSVFGFVARTLTSSGGAIP